MAESKRSMKALALRAVRVALILSGVLFWVALAVGYALDASPFDSFHVTAGWSRPAFNMPPAYKQRGEAHLLP